MRYGTLGGGGGMCSRVRQSTARASSRKIQSNNQQLRFTVQIYMIQLSLYIYTQSLRNNCDGLHNQQNNITHDKLSES